MLEHWRFDTQFVDVRDLAMIPPSEVEDELNGWSVDGPNPK